MAADRARRSAERPDPEESNSPETRIIGGVEVPFFPEAPEWENLVSADIATSVEALSDKDPYAELKRTLCALYALDNLARANGDNPEDYRAGYQAFTAGQPPERRLSEESYLEVSRLVNRVASTPETYRTLQVAMLISDNFKNENLLAEVGLRPGDNHDEALMRAFQPEYEDARQRLFPSLDDPTFLPPEGREELQTMMNLMSFNFPGWAQSQSSTAHLEILGEDIPKEVKERFLLHGMLDVMGARGTKNVTAAMAYDQPTHDMFMDAFAALTIESSNKDIPLTPFMRERLYLALRAEYYGVSPETYTPLINSTELAKTAMTDLSSYWELFQRHTDAYNLITQIRLANMCRYASPEQFSLLQEAYNELPPEKTQHIMSLLSFSGAYDLDYGPAYVRQILGQDKASIQRGLRLLNVAFSEMELSRSRAVLVGGETHDFNLDSEEIFPTFTKVEVLLRELAIQSKDPDFDMTGHSVIAEAEGSKIIPHLITRDEKIALEFVYTREAQRARFDREPGIIERLRKSSLDSQPAQVQAIIAEANAHPEVYGGPTAQESAREIFGAFTTLYGATDGHLYAAHFLQEVAIATHGVEAQLAPGAMDHILESVTRDEFNYMSALRFDVQHGLLLPRLEVPHLYDLDFLPDINLPENFANKRILYVGMGGGSDVVQAAALSHLIERHVPDSQTAGAVSVRNPRRQVHGGRQLSNRTREVTPDMRPTGNWRFLERIPQEVAPQLRTFLISDTNPGTVTSELETLINETNADLIVGVDTGGDSLHTTTHAGFSARSKIDTTPDQDAQVTEALERLGLPGFTSVVAVGVDSPGPHDPVDTATRLRQLQAQRYQPGRDDRQFLQALYHAYRMDGSGNAEGRFGKTPLAWLLALEGRQGLQAMNLPLENVLSVQNRWRTFISVTNPMAEITFAPLQRRA